MDYVLPYDEKIMQEETRVMRVVVGWLRDEGYVSFTFQQEGEQKYNKKSPDLTNFDSIKATTVPEAFQLWKQLIVDKEQVSISLPMGVATKKMGVIQGDFDYEETIRQLSRGVPGLNPDMWKDNFDADFIEWATSVNNQFRYMSGEGVREDLRNNDKRMWKLWGDRAVAGEMPEIVARTVTKQAK